MDTMMDIEIGKNVERWALVASAPGKISPTILRVEHSKDTIRQYMFELLSNELQDNIQLSTVGLGCAIARYKETNEIALILQIRKVRGLFVVCDEENES